MEFHYTVTTEKSIEQAIRNIEEHLKKHNFGVLWQLNLTEKLQSKGIEFRRPFHVLEVCNPFEAARVLEKNNLVGYFLPCKIVVFEQDGNTHIGLPKPTAMISLIHDDELGKIAEEIETTLVSVINDSK